MSPVFPYGETITVHSRSATRDLYGDDVWADNGPGVVIEGCAVWARASTENTQGRDTLIDGLTVLAPPGTAVAATDQVTVRGDRYDVVGDVGQYRNPFTGTDPGVEIQLTKVTG